MTTGANDMEDQEAPLAHISRLTGAKVRVFLTEVAEGVSNYRSLHSLTQQVEHQYHGRFLIELIQNAHDAFEPPNLERQNRVEVRYDAADSVHGTLIVANDGLPFSRSNFERLSQLGQSDKDPQKSIGNKGIGFRSVLEISDCPEVYSRITASSPSFDGYCFAFRPSVVASLAAPIEQLAASGTVSNWATTAKPLVESWSAEMLQKFREQVRRKEAGWLTGETAYLSPYLLPVPLVGERSALVQELETRHFSTVIRLPLKSAALQSYVLERMDEIEPSTLLFLEKFSLLRIHDGASRDRTFRRNSSPLADDSKGKRVVIDAGNDSPATYATWSTELHVPTASNEFRSAVAALPGRWPEIVDVSVSMAVRLGATPDVGKFSIYLPTKLSTGSAVHLNAPFFGDMSRTSIDFKDAYNRQLRETAADLVLTVVRERLAGKGEDEAIAIVDCLAPTGSAQLGESWIELIDAAASRAGASLAEEALALSEDGWKAWSVTSLLPTVPKALVLTEESLRRHATFDIFHNCLDGRRQQVEKWARSQFPDVGASPLPESLAETLASVARELREQRGDWNVFWREVTQLMPDGQSELAKHELLLGTDGELHRATDGVRVFFVPRQGTQDDSDVSGEPGTTEVPMSLKSSVAFLSEQIQVYETNRPTAQTPVRAYLAGSSLVTPFRVETIFSEVLSAATPELPQPLGGEHHERCGDILAWALRLMGNVVARGRGAEATLRLLRNIPVPCRGGWFPLREASFGPGWPGKTGDHLEAYLESLKVQAFAHARDRILQPPEDVAWRGAGLISMGLLAVGGVFNGLRLLETKPNTWGSEFEASSSDFRLPTKPPPVASKEQWLEWVEVAQRDARPPFVTPQRYQIGSLWTFPGMTEFPGLSDKAREALSSLVLESLPHWGAGLERLAISKERGQWSRLEVTSPLVHFLRTRAWLAVRDQNSLVWSVPRERWLVPADTLANRARHFAHLRALPAAFARNIGQRPQLVEALRALGMPVFDPHSTSPSLALLEALTSAVGSKEVADANVLLGQIRDAWQRFRPGAERRALTQIAVRGRDRRLTAQAPQDSAPVFIPDSGAYVAALEAFDFPVAAMGTADAKDLRDWFVAAYGSKVQFTSALALVPKVDDSLWTGANARSIADSELSWLVRPLLVLAAQGRGVHSPAFKSRLETLSGMRVDWVHTLRVAVVSGSDELATAKVRAMWEPKHKTLIVADSCRTQLEELSTALAQVLDREDLELSLRFILRAVPSIDEAPDDIATFLAPLRSVSKEEIHEVLEHLKGDVGHAARMLAVFVRVLSNKADTSAIEGASSEDELTAAIATEDIAQLGGVALLQIAHDSQGLFEFGRRVSHGLGIRAALARWNEVLLSIGQPPLFNQQWSLQLEACLQEAASLVKRIAAHAIRLGSPLSFAQMQQQYVGLLEVEELGRTHWEVSFPQAMELVAKVVRSWLSDECIIQSIGAASSVRELRARLEASGVAMEPDPDECSRRNQSLTEVTARELERLRLASWLRGSSSPQQGPESRIEDYRAACAEALAGPGFASEWSEAEVFARLKRVRYPNTVDFEVAVDAAADLNELRSNLGISEEELVEVESRLSAITAERMHKRNLVKVCGHDFDSSDDNLGNLWALLNERMPEESLNYDSLDLTKPATLAPIKAKKEKRREVSPPNSRKTARTSKAVEALIGLFGEIHVFRLLRKKYGDESVSASSWVSENSRWVFPSNLTDDGKGCDFAFTVKGKQYRVEVKATTGGDETFTLGSSEIRLAMDIGTKTRRRKEVFLLIHVKNALSATPEAVVLPNPYDPKHAGTFSIEDADARVRYRPK